MKIGKLFWGLSFVLLAVALILDAVGVLAGIESSVGEISILTIVCTLLLFCITAVSISKKHFGFSVVPLGFLFMFIEKNIAFLCNIEGGDIINNWLLLGCSILLWIGIAILLPKNRRRWKVANSVTKIKNHGNGSSVRYIDATTLTREKVENELGSLVVRFENEEAYPGEGELIVSNELGSMVVEVPASWRFACKVTNTLGAVKSEKCCAPADAPLLTITGDNELGSFVVKTV